MSINLASTSSSPANTQHSDPGPTPSILEDVISGLIEPRSDAPGEYKPTLIANRPGGLTMREEIGNSLATSDSFDISVAFVSAEAVLSLFEDFRSHHETATRAGTLITSTKNHFNDPRAFWELLHLQNTTGVDVRVWEGSRNASVAAMAQGQPFHPKGYIFSRRMKDGTPYYDLYVGSSNLTGAALTTQREWNLKVSSLADGELVGQFQDEIDSQVADSVPLTEEWIKQYEEDFKKYAPPRHEILQSFEGHDIQPNAMQQEALANLKKLREQGEHRAIIVSATGTGKTYLSAFDVRECQPKRMLYIAQQQMILQTAMNSYQKVLGCDESELGLYSGTSKQQDRRYVFATVQTMRQPEVLAQFKSDEFDYVLVDEVHHAGAEGYQRVINHFGLSLFGVGEWVGGVVVLVG